MNDETVDDVFRDFTSRTYYLNCDDNFDDDEVDDHNHEIANQNIESYNLSPLHCLPKPEIIYTTNRVIKIRPNYEVSSSIPSSNSSTISSSTNTTNTTSTNITITSTTTTNREILIVTSPTNRDVTSPTGLSSGAVDIRRRRDKIKKRSDLSDKM
ncbi:unnamed protein product [Schistosoma margrebowiei]|uniref:Uncharacterized protein n=1 Tax=Schistosoma margrebowiei TaxID=48269 RepID=A0A3P7Y0D5_9TREM|nr:unnamed protein product [Schistosoma margrebowiei]